MSDALQKLNSQVLAQNLTSKKPSEYAVLSVVYTVVYKRS
jgi:hypothetical protein